MASILTRLSFLLLGVVILSERALNESTVDPWISLDGQEGEEGEDSVVSILHEQHSSPLCRCWRSSDQHGSFVSTPVDVECKCRGSRVLSVPSNLPADVNHITMFDCALKKLSRGELQHYANALSDFVLDKAPLLVSIEEGTFHGLVHLQRIYIRRAPALISLPDGVFRLPLPSLHVLLIKQTGLRVFPNLAELETLNILHTVDLGENQLETVPSNSVRLPVDDFLLNGNALCCVEASAFNGSQIATLNLKGNHQLVDLHPDAFAGLSSLRRLDLSQTSINSLPTKGLSELEVLRVAETKTLKEIPSVYNYQLLREAHLTYPYHCCAFAFPAAHDPQEHARHQLLLAELQSKYCNTHQQKTSPENGSLLMPQADLDYETDLSGSIDLGVITNSQEDKSGADGGVFHQGPYQTPADRKLSFHAFCGNFTAQTHHQVVCTPQPDAFNPCEDILGATWLRIAAWFVAVASLVGNLAVILVLVQTSRYPMVVSKFLMINLAWADLCMGLYLFMIIGMDVNTIGVYFNHAIDWQNGIGCQIAGFLTVFATELSVFTLVVITTERWYTITYAINLNRRLRFSTMAKVLAAGWIVSLVMASLPIAGISSFSTTSICLPLENNNLSDTIYLLLLLVLNAIAFLFICLCYSHMYRSISGHRQSVASHSDATVAKRMALLVFTNLACWTPIAFFGLTAVAGYPLISVTHSKILLVFFYPLNACTNPFLYALITKQYRRDVFQLLSRYGFCTERAMRYRNTYSFAQNQNNPVVAGSQLESTVHQTGGVYLDDSKFERRKSSTCSAKRIRTLPRMIKISTSRSEIDEVQENIEMTSVKTRRDNVTNQCSAEFGGETVQSRHEVVFNRTESNGSAQNRPNDDAPECPSPDHLTLSYNNSMDSPHPLKHCLIRNTSASNDRSVT